jgi:hypothetical protein
MRPRVLSQRLLLKYLLKDRHLGTVHHNMNGKDNPRY